MRNFLDRLREWATLYEPATAKALVTAFVQIFLVAGISLGNLPEVADAVLAFVALLATVLAGRSIRKSVYSRATHDAEVSAAYQHAYRQGAFDQQAVSRGDR